MVAFCVTKHRLDSTATLEQVLQPACALVLVTDQHFDLLRMMLFAAKALIHGGMLGASACESFHLLHCWVKRCAIVRIAMLGSNAHNPVAMARCDNDNFTAKFVSFVNLAFGNTLDFRRVNAVALAFVLLFLLMNLFCPFK